MKTRNEKIIDVDQFDKLVQKTYGRVYNFQQQEGCKDRGIFRFTVPATSEDEGWPDTVPEIVNDEKMGVNFAAWLARDPKQSFPDPDKPKEIEPQWAVDLWWSRNFYPPFQDVVDDLHAKGLVEAGNYAIDIDW